MKLPFEAMSSKWLVLLSTGAYFAFDTKEQVEECADTLLKALAESGETRGAVLFRAVKCWTYTIDTKSEDVNE